MGVQFTPLTDAERKRLDQAPWDNATTGKALRMDPLTTGWMPGSDEVAAEDVIASIRSVPCHY